MHLSDLRQADLSTYSRDVIALDREQIDSVDLQLAYSQSRKCRAAAPRTRVEVGRLLTCLRIG